MRTDPLGRRLLAEFLGTCLLVTAVVGSGIAAARLSPGDVGLELLENTAATVGAQISGALGGSLLANAMFALPTFEASTKTRSSGPLWLAEVVATFGLVVVIFAVVRSGRASAAPFAVGAYIGGAYFFTSSTSFANPAVTIGRTITDTFAGIKPTSAPAFIAMQVVGGLLAVGAIRVLYPNVAGAAADVVLPHPSAHDRPPAEADR